VFQWLEGFRKEQPYEKEGVCEIVLAINLLYILPPRSKNFPSSKVNLCKRLAQSSFDAGKSIIAVWSGLKG